MPTSYRGRSSSQKRTPGYGYSSFGSLWGSSSQSGLGGWAKKGKKTTTAAPATAYKNCCNTFQNKIDSYRTLCEQAKGPAKFPRPTPTTLNSFANWINKGAIVQTVSSAQLSRWVRGTKFTYSFSPRNCSTTMCKNILTKKFGKACIKAVTRGKTGNFIVATAATTNGRIFNFPR